MLDSYNLGIKISHFWAKEPTHRQNSVTIANQARTKHLVYSPKITCVQWQSNLKIKFQSSRFIPKNLIASKIVKRLLFNIFGVDGTHRSQIERENIDECTRADRLTNERKIETPGGWRFVSRLLRSRASVYTDLFGESRCSCERPNPGYKRVRYTRWTFLYSDIVHEYLIWKVLIFIGVFWTYMRCFLNNFSFKKRVELYCFLFEFANFKYFATYFSNM